jgi:hypothetical protein
MWGPQDIEVVLLDDLTDGDVATAEVVTPAGRLSVMAEVVVQGQTSVLRDLHMHGADVGSNAFGAERLPATVWAVMQYLESYDVIVVEGAARTTGASPGRRPGRLRFARAALSRRFGG